MEKPVQRSEQTPYEQSYYGQVRARTGSDIKLIHLGARAIVQDAEKRILLVKRSDDGDWVMPAGGMELGESILDCCKREVKEESGFDVVSAIPIKIESDPKYDFVTSYGDPYQTFRVVFLVTEWTGELVKQTDETVDADFFARDALPEIPDIYHETLTDLDNFDGTVILT
jgi:ADP-ribose pyrophosphatase YjhB (NUDIX family)